MTLPAFVFLASLSFGALWTLGPAALLIVILVVVHEFGHFLAAKAFGVGVPVFSVGMGPRLFGFEYNGTDYRFSALPIGGYVMMSGADPFGEEDAMSMVDPEEDFMKKPVWQRFIVMFAGPAMNLALPVMLFTGAYMIGEQRADAVISTVIPGFEADRLGFEAGDEVVSVAGTPVDIFGEFIEELDAADGMGDIPVVVRRDGQTQTIVVPDSSLERDLMGFISYERIGFLHREASARIGVDDPASPAGKAGLKTGDLVVAVNGAEVGNWRELEAALAGPGPYAVDYKRVEDKNIVSEQTQVSVDAAWTRPADDAMVNGLGMVPAQVYIGTVRVDSPAHSAGLEPSDRLFSVDGKDVLSWNHVISLVRATATDITSEADVRALELVIIRDGQRLKRNFTPKLERELVGTEVRYRPIMGVTQYPDAYIAGPSVLKRYSLLESVPRAAERSVEMGYIVVDSLRKLAVGKLKPQESLGGPVAIFQAASSAASMGLIRYLEMMAGISISLGIVNLLPVPVLDGGQILFYAIEGIRGRPLSLEIREKVQMVGVLALAALMLAVTVMDVSRWLGG